MQWTEWTREMLYPLSLTTAEQIWSQQHPLVRIGSSSREVPPDLVRLTDDSLSGILPDLHDRLGKRLGIAFEFVDALLCRGTGRVHIDDQWSYARRISSAISSAVTC